jgi:hypothetical protein
MSITKLHCPSDSMRSCFGIKMRCPYVITDDAGLNTARRSRSITANKQQKVCVYLLITVENIRRKCEEGIRIFQGTQMVGDERKGTLRAGARVEELFS